jgi:CheY-specific phosphatase CheX
VTFSTRSQYLLSPTDRNAFVAAVTNVCEQSFYAFAEPAGPAVYDRAAAYALWYEVLVDFTGPFDGSLYVAVPAPLGHDLFTAFIGIDPGDPIEDGAIEDLIGEFGNMACGAWLTTLRESKCFALDHPVVRTTAEPSLIGATMVDVNDQPVAVGIRLARRES